jgi:hydrogenase-1 operon protein HyaF
MTSESIPMPPPVAADPLDSPMVRALFAELLSKMTALIEEDRSSSIDLRGLPLPPGALEALRNWLGEGETRATVKALGTTTIQETAFAGLWWVRHDKAQGNLIAEGLEISYCPTLLLPERDTVQSAAKELRRRIESSSNTPSSSKSADPG